MKLTKEQIYALNNISVATQDVKLGDLVSGFLEGGVASVNATPIEHASEKEAGLVKKCAEQPKSDATTIKELVNDFNSLIEKLKNAGIMA